MKKIIFCLFTLLFCVISFSCSNLLNENSSNTSKSSSFTFVVPREAIETNSDASKEKTLKVICAVIEKETKKQLNEQTEFIYPTDKQAKFLYG